MQQTLLKIFSFKKSLLFLLILISPAHTMDVFNAGAKMLVNPTPTGDAEIINGYTPSERQLLTILKQDPTALKSLEEKGDISFQHKSIVPGLGTAFNSNDTQQMIQHSYSYSNNNTNAQPLQSSHTNQKKQQISLAQPQKQQEFKGQLTDLFKKQEQLITDHWPKRTTSLPNDNVTQQQRLEQFNTFNNALTNGFDYVSALASAFGHSRSAARIQQLGTASFKIATSMNALIEGASAAGGASFINPYVGLAVGVCSLIGLFKDEKEDNSLEVIMDAMHQYAMALSRQMQEHFECTMQRFDHVEKKIDRYGMAMLQEFFSLHQKQDFSLEKLFELRKDFIEKSSLIQGSVDHVNESLAHKYSSLTANLEALRTEKINEVVHNALHDSLKVDLPLEKFDKHIDKLYTKATVRALEAHLTGGNVDISNYEAIASALTAQPATQDSNSALQQPAYSNINLVRRYLNQHCNDDTPMLANPLILIQCTDAFTTMLQQKLTSDVHYPASANNKQLLITMLKQLHAQGTALTNFLKKIHGNGYVEKIAEQYQCTVGEISNIFNVLKQTHEQEKTRELQNNSKKIHDNETAALITQSYNCEKQKTAIATMLNELYERNYSPASFPVIRNGNLYSTKWWRVFTYQGNNITGTFTHGRCRRMSENNDWTVCNNLINRTDADYEAQAKQYIGNKIDVAVKSIKDQKDDMPFSLFETPHKPQLSHSLSSIMYPENDAPTQFSALPLPQNGLPLPDYYRIREQQGHGAIRHEYTYDTDYFHIKSYFISNQGVKTLILHTRNKHLDDLNSPYLPYEFAQNCWYGGYYAKKNDVFSFVNQSANEVIINTSWSGHLPPVEPYGGLIDTWNTSAETVFIDNTNNNASAHESHAQLKREFNNKLIEQLSPGTQLYAALKKLDAQCKLIDSLLALAHNQDYNTLECSILRSSNMLTNEYSIKKYLTDYSNPQSDLANTNQHLLHHLAQSLELINNLAAQSKHITYKPLQDLQNTLDRLSATLHMVEAKAIISKALPYHPETEIEHKDQEIATLRAELQQSRNEIKSLHEKFDALIKLLTKEKITVIE